MYLEYHRSSAFRMSTLTSADRQIIKEHGSSYAVADFCNPHSCTGKPLNRIKPLPLSTSLLTEPKKASSVGNGKNSYYQSAWDHPLASPSPSQMATIRRSFQYTPSPSPSTASHSQ